MADDKLKVAQNAPAEQPEVVDDLGTIRVDENTTVNVERTGPAPEPEIAPEVIQAQNEERDRQLASRPEYRSPEEKAAIAEETGLPPGDAPLHSTSVPTTAPSTAPREPVTSAPVDDGTIKSPGNIG